MRASFSSTGYLGHLWPLMLGLTGPAEGAINVELRPSTQTVNVGSVVDVEIYAVSDDASNQPFRIIRVLFEWDPDVLELTGHNDNGPYPWSTSGFTNDSGGDGINNTFTDGDAFYQAIGLAAPIAEATPAGLLISTLQFTALTSALDTPVDIVPQIGMTLTQVLDDLPPLGQDVTGTNGSAMVTIHCQVAGDCDDDNPCTDDDCVSQFCEHIPNDAVDPNDGLFCNGIEDFCLNGTIIFVVPPPDCDDGLSCTADGCNEATDQCDNIVKAGSCEIDSACFINGAVNPLNECEVCDPIADQSNWSPQADGTSCGDPTDTDCDGEDTCDGLGVCQDNLVLSGVACGDPLDNDCTDPDSCDGLGNCLPRHATNGTLCNDGLFCTVTDSCDNGVCVGVGDPCLLEQTCNEQGDVCRQVDLELQPASQTVLVGQTIAIDLVALSGAGVDQPIGALSAILFWSSSLMELSGNVDNGPYGWSRSEFTPDPLLDDLNNPCAQGEQNCLPGNDGNALYTALAQTGSPAFAPTGGLQVTTFEFTALQAGSGQLTLLETFGAFSATVVTDGEAPGLDITGVLGGPASITIVECFGNDDCNDGLFCTLTDECVDDLCVHSGDPCPGQICDEEGNSCVECLVNADCDDGLFCNGEESCQNDACTNGIDPCPLQLCDETNSECADCFNSVDCDDQIACTTDSCTGGACTNDPLDSFCADGLFCSGVETCDPQLECVTSGNPCPDPASCEEMAGNCGGCDSPAVTAQGSRYLSITAPGFDGTVALLVIGDPNDTSVECISLYVQSDGSLDKPPEFLTPAQWGTVLVTDGAISPSTTYLVHTECGDEQTSVLSAATSVTTGVWGDVNDSGLANLDDILCALDALGGVFNCAPEHVDLRGSGATPCIPNGFLNLDDALAVIDAVGGIGYTCPPPCSSSCNPPSLVAEGSRYLAVTPAPGSDPVALLVTGEVLSCFGPGLYVQSDGTLSASPVFQIPDVWGTVHVGDLEIIPFTDYTVQADTGVTLCAPASATTWGWADVTNDGTANLDDVLCLLDGIGGILNCTLYNLDLQGDVPDRTLNLDDLLAALDTIGGLPYPGPVPCP